MRIERVGVKPTYSGAVVHGDTIYLSGQVPWESVGIEAQTNEVFEQIERQLTELGSGMDRILSMQIFLADPIDYAAMNSVFASWIPPGAAPARNTICGVKFPNSSWRIEIVIVAAK